MDNKDQLYEVGSITEETIQMLEHNGLRMTVQRRLIVEIMTKQQCASAKEVWFEAKRVVPDIGIATVYRLINRLEQIGIIAKSRSLGMGKVTPVLGNITDINGKTIETRHPLNLEDLIRVGLISYGALGNKNEIRLNLVGDKVNITVVS